MFFPGGKILLILKFLVIALAVWGLLKIISLPIRLIWKLAINTGCGFAILLVLNWLSPYTGVLFDLNFLTSAIVGFLGLPGIILLFVVHLILEWGI